MFESCITFYGSYNVQIIFALQQKSVILSKQKRTQSDPKHSFQYDKMNTIFNNFNHICIKSDKSTVKTNISHKTRLCHVGFPAIYLRIKSQIFEVQSDNVFQSTLKLKITYFVLKIRYFISKKKQQQQIIIVRTIWLMYRCRSIINFWLGLLGSTQPCYNMVVWILYIDHVS